MGLIRKIDFGRNSAVTKIISVETTILTSNNNPDDFIPLNIGVNVSAISIPYTTNAMLLPRSIVPMNLDGCLVIILNANPRGDDRLASNSSLSLLAVIYAISIPEKKAENTIEISIMIIEEESSIDVSRLRITYDTNIRIEPT